MPLKWGHGWVVTSPQNNARDYSTLPWCKINHVDRMDICYLSRGIFMYVISIYILVPCHEMGWRFKIRRGWERAIYPTIHKSLHCSVVSGAGLGVVSLTFHELSKIISRKYTMPEITFTVRVSSWNFVCVPKAWLWTHVQSFSLKFSSEVRFLQYTNFERISWRVRETLVKQPPRCTNTHSLNTYKHTKFGGSWSVERRHLKHLLPEQAAKELREYGQNTISRLQLV